MSDGLDFDMEVVENENATGEVRTADKAIEVLNEVKEHG